MRRNQEAAERLTRANELSTIPRLEFETEQMFQQFLTEVRARQIGEADAHRNRNHREQMRLTQMRTNSNTARTMVINTRLSIDDARSLQQYIAARIEATPEGATFCPL